MSVSSQRAAAAVLSALALLLAGCASTQDAEVRRLQARSTYEQGFKHLADRNISLGLQSLRDATRLDPDNPIFRNSLGVVLLDLGNTAEAQAEFQKAVELDPGYAEAHHNLGLSLARQGRLEEAVATYRKALSLPIYPTPEVGYYNLGYAYMELNRPREAEEALRAALRLSPRLVSAHYMLGLLLSRTGRVEEAKAALRTARDLDPASPFSRAATESLKALGEGG